MANSITGREMVGAKGFEPSTPCTPCRCATRLRYAPTESEIIRVIGSRPITAGAAAGMTLPVQQLEDAFQLLAQARRRNGLRDGHGLRRHGTAARLLEAVARPVDGEAVLVEQLPDAPDQEHFVVLIVT